MAQNFQAEEKVTYVSEITVKCEGEGKNLGHPLIYLHFTEGKNSIDCPYCGRVFKLSTDNEAH